VLHSKTRKQIVGSLKSVYRFPIVSYKNRYVLIAKNTQARRSAEAPQWGARVSRSPVSPAAFFVSAPSPYRRESGLGAPRRRAQTVSPANSVKSPLAAPFATLTACALKRGINRVNRRIKPNPQARLEKAQILKVASLNLPLTSQLSGSIAPLPLRKLPL
jgi:hypothetical protein